MGKTKREATQLLRSMSHTDKHELLFHWGINFNDLPAWQKRGTGFYYKQVEREGYNPKKQEKVLVKRRVLEMDMEFPMKQDYSTFLENLLQTA